MKSSDESRHIPFLFPKSSIFATMKILHTSDWHLGHVLYGYDRTEEQQAMLEQMVEIAKRENPDVFLVSGDVYHTSDPRLAVQKMFNRAIVTLCRTCPEMTVVVTAGNHDSGPRHEIFKTPWEALNVFMVGKLDRDNLESHIIGIPGKGFVIALPFINDRFLPEDIYQQLIDMVDQKNTDNLPVVFSAHTAIKGGDFSGHEDVGDSRVGGVDIVDVSTIGKGYDYLALGHIHKPQFVHTGRHNVRYSGSPMAVSFDEAYPHSVTIVKIPTHNAPLTEENYTFVEIRNPRPLITLPDAYDTKVFGKWNDVYKKYEDYPADTQAYIRLNIADPEAMPSNAFDKAVEQANGKDYIFCCINKTPRAADFYAQGQQQMTVEEFQATDPWKVVQMYAADTHDDSFDEQGMKPLFEEVLDELKTKEDQA
jgi:exonuclease SbcD